MWFNFDQEREIGESKRFNTEIDRIGGSDIIKVYAKKNITISPGIQFKSHIGMIVNSTDRRTLSILNKAKKKDLSITTEFYSFRSIRAWNAICVILNNNGYKDISIRKGSIVCILAPIDKQLHYEETLI